MKTGMPLGNVKVVDLSTFAAASSTARLLADWGADVIKVESLRGDAWRNYGTVGSTPTTEEENPCWEINNGNKRAIALNLRDPKGQEILHRLLKEADVFLTNYRINALMGMKLTYEDLAPQYPQLVWAHIGGYGSKGPDAKRPGFDVASYWARSGMLVDPEQPGYAPLTLIYAFGDIATGEMLAGGICAALCKQKQTGKGDKVEVSLMSNAVWMAGLMIMSTQERYGDVFPKSRLQPPSPLTSSYKCKDEEWLLLCIIEYERYFPSLCEVLGREDLAGDERYNTLAHVKEHAQEFVELLDSIFATKNRDEWLEALLKEDIVCDRIVHFKDVTKDQQAWANNYLYNFTFTNGEQAVLPNTPVSFKIDGGFAKRAPLLGEHTKEILSDLGYSNTDIETMAIAQIIKAR